MIKKINVNNLTSLNKMASSFNLVITESDLNNSHSYYFGYFYNNILIAFLNYSIYYERAEINYIYVDTEYRKKNIATRLLEYMFKNNSNLENITLEVRKSNNAAINLYEKNGFEQCAIRKNYYANEDAILMIKKFGDNNE